MAAKDKLVDHKTLARAWPILGEFPSEAFLIRAGYNQKKLRFTKKYLWKPNEVLDYFKNVRKYPPETTDAFARALGIRNANSGRKKQ